MNLKEKMERYMKVFRERKAKGEMMKLDYYLKKLRMGRVNGKQEGTAGEERETGM